MLCILEIMPHISMSMPRILEKVLRIFKKALYIL